MEIEVSERNYERVLELKERIGADSVDEVIDWLLDFWFSWSKRRRDSAENKFGFGFDL